MKALVVAVSVLSSTLLVAGCTAEMAPEDEALLQDEQGDQPTSSEQPADEPVAETSEALCSCATELHCSNGQLTVYENSDCCGGNFFFCPGNYPDLRKYTTNLFWGANWNDRISRLYTSGSPNKKVGVYVYQHVNYGGDRKYFGPGTFADIGGSLWNDQISSIKVIALP
jgi:hypothetical protein